MGKLRTEGALETVAAIASESVARVEIIKKVRAASRTWSLCESVFIAFLSCSKSAESTDIPRDAKRVGCGR
jgi:hypothetical protein